MNRSLLAGIYILIAVKATELTKVKNQNKMLVHSFHGAYYTPSSTESSFDKKLWGCWCGWMEAAHSKAWADVWPTLWEGADPCVNGRANLKRAPNACGCPGALWRPFVMHVSMVGGRGWTCRKKGVRVGEKDEIKCDVSAQLAGRTSGLFWAPFTNQWKC